MRKTIYRIFEIKVDDEDKDLCAEGCRFYEDDGGAAGVAWCRLKDNKGDDHGGHTMVELEFTRKKCEHCGHESTGYLRTAMCHAGEKC